ncbi:hypothetical protein [Neorhizobium sp. JUb45]|uniref:hypothetical protein n=1 Tax=Neorhizobium sp. JUb45 TaxID=2485113 RepID=UPI00104AE403|nr:hypothetical protein [Neorhizobium sp. JUb45]TCQ97334.1 hypothetical protein EDF70_11380 [Neorhizobium sp. JUb45]
MLTQILLTTVIVPLLIGAAIALIGRGNKAGNIALAALLVPVAAAIASVSIEGMPALPPIAAKHKLPVLLVIGGITFGGVSLVLKRSLHQRWIAGLIGVISLALPAWWLGRNVLAANSMKATTLAIVLLIVGIQLFFISDGRSRKASSAALPAAPLATAIATALTAILGGYIGMAQLNGALAALFGGWMLVRYISYLRGNEDAFMLDGLAAISFIWTAAMGVTMTTLFSPSAAPVALVLAVAPIVVFAVLSKCDFSFAHQPRFLRPLIFGLLTALPAIAAILVAVSAAG